MPDWFYRTVAQRALFLLPDRFGRGVALGVIGALGRSPAGRGIIDFLGHMAPAPELAVSVAGVPFASPFGLGWRVDPENRATSGLARFGVGCIEIWPGPMRDVRRRPGAVLEDTNVVPDAIREASGSAASCACLVRGVDHNGSEFLRLPGGAKLPVMAWADPPVTRAGGLVLQAGERLEAGRWRVPAAMPREMPEIVRDWRERLGRHAPLIVSGGVDCPRDAVALVEAGANLVLIDAGLVYRGPGLAKRCNAALQRSRSAAVAAEPKVALFRRAWFWAATLGLSLLAGGAATLALALTRVLLPYDEHFLGLSSELLRRTSPRLFDFMAHDRATLAGTMLGLGWLYLLLGVAGMRRRNHGARTAVIASALTGFASFFSFFGFGYFDTLHAFVAVVLFQLTVQIMVGEEGGSPAGPEPLEIEDAAWRQAHWGQLFWIVHAMGLLAAGGVILSIGMTSVFVREDIAFLCMSEPEVRALDVRLFGVVAHDRATLGGMLLACGIGSLLPLLWCFRRGEAWLWAAMLGLGLPAYAAALGVHFWVGYTDLRHLVPAIAGLLLWLGGLGWSRAYLCRQ